MLDRAPQNSAAMVTGTGRVLKIVLKRKVNPSNVLTNAPVPVPALTTAEQRRKILEGFPGPSASAHAIVAALRNSWHSSSTADVPKWDECLVLPVYLADFASKLRDGKRPREQDLDPARHPAADRIVKKQREDSSAQGGDKTAIDVRASACNECEVEPPPTTSDAGVKVEDHAGRPGQQVDHRPGSSTSDDQATMIMFPSPDEPGHRIPEGMCQQQTEEASLRYAAEPQQEHLLNHRPSVGCQAGHSVVLAPSCLDSSSCSFAAASMCSVSPFDFLLPSLARRSPEKVDDDFIGSIMNKAKDAKYAADKQRGGLAAPWTVEALCKYVQSAVMFMEACEYILRASKERSGRLVRLRAGTVPGLYGSTAKLLSYTAQAAETALGSDLSKDALRILTERLCAVCHMREAVHAPVRFTEAAVKAQQLSHKFNQAHQSVAPLDGPSHHAGVACSLGESEGTRGQPSPNDSTNSSQDVVIASSRAQHQTSATQQQVLHAESIQRLIEQAKQVARFSDLIRRSSLGFQTFLERPDYRNSRKAKLVSMHIAVVSMDFGGIDGFRMLSHANKALSRIAEMSAAM